MSLARHPVKRLGYGGQRARCDPGATWQGRTGLPAALVEHRLSDRQLCSRACKRVGRRCSGTYDRHLREQPRWDLHRVRRWLADLLSGWVTCCYSASATGETAIAVCLIRSLSSTRPGTRRTAPSSLSTSVEFVARAYMGYTTCRIFGAQNGSLELADGVYVWPEGLAHYVTAHAIRMPDVFVDHERTLTDGIESADIDETWWRSLGERSAGASNSHGTTAPDEARCKGRLDPICRTVLGRTRSRTSPILSG